MWSLDKQNYRRTLGLVALIIVAAGSFVFAIWGMLGFSHAPFASFAGKAQVITLSVGDCKECSSPASFLSELETQGLVIGKNRSVPADSREGKKLIEQYKITKLPTVLLRKASAGVQSVVAQFGDLASDGTFVLRDVVPPYRDVVTNATKGRFGIILLTDKTCKECYDATLHKTPLSRLGMVPSDEKTVDIADPEGKLLIEKYHIETVPTLIMQGDLGEYQSLSQVWSQVGTIEPDGAYIFRKGQESMGTYRVLKTQEIKKPAA